MAEVVLTPAIILSKLHPPRLTAQHVPRPRLVDFLNRHSDRPVTLLSAAAGFGKTTLLGEWLASSPRPSAWVSLDQRDNDLSVFVEYVVAAVRTAFPTLAFKTDALLQALIPVPLDVLAATLSNDLAQIDTEFFLVLDDYHIITNPQIHELVSRLLSHPPHSLHLVVSTRSEPALPLMSLRSRGQLSELRSEHLRFTLEETAAFIRNDWGDAVSDAQITRLHDESEGWVAGLQLLGPVPDHSGSAQRALQTGEPNHAITEYLFEEVFTLQPCWVQQHLLRMSILDRFSAGLCEALCDREAADAEPRRWASDFITHLESANLFLSPLDDRHEFFRFHHLFRAFLSERAHQELSPPQIADLHRRASEWFAANGWLEDAVDHALAADDETAAAELVALHRIGLYNQEQFARLMRLLRVLPVEVKAHNPELLLAEARIATLTWRHTEAAVLVSEAQRALANTTLDPPRRTLASAELAVHRANLDLWSGNVERLEAECRFALDVLPLQSSHLRGLAQIGVASSMYLRGNAAGAVEYLDDQLARTSYYTVAHAGLLQALGFIHWLTGDLTNLAVAADHLLTISEEQVLPDQKALAHWFLGTVSYARNELQAAERHLTEAVSARFNMRLLWWCQAAGILALTYDATARPEQARQTLEDVHAFLLERHAIRLLPNIGAFQAELDRRQGRMAEAVAWAKVVDLVPLIWPLAAVEPHLERVLVLVSLDGEAELDEAAGILAELRDLCRRIPNRRLLLQIDAIEALLLEERDQHEEALQALERAVIAAEPEGWIRLFVDLGEPMALLLTELSRRRVKPYAASRILAAFPARHVATGSPDQSRLIEPLSARELEILALLSQRDSNKEIAARLFIARGTVKRHTVNIYRKLGVNDRREAVLAAHKLGLLPAHAPAEQA